MRDLLSDNEIELMRKEIDKDASLPKIAPPKGRKYWDVTRIVKTLEYFQAIEAKYNKSAQRTQKAEPLT